MLQSLHIVINMSPTEEGAVSLSLGKVHARRDWWAERCVGSGVVEGATALGTGASSGLASQVVDS